MAASANDPGFRESTLYDPRAFQPTRATGCVKRRRSSSLPPLGADHVKGRLKRPSRRSPAPTFSALSGTGGPRFLRFESQERRNSLPGPKHLRRGSRTINGWAGPRSYCGRIRTPHDGTQIYSVIRRDIYPPRSSLTLRFMTHLPWPKGPRHASYHRLEGATAARSNQTATSGTTLGVHTRLFRSAGRNSRARPAVVGGEFASNAE